ncbi:MAG: zinc transporter ZntB [Sphingobium sp.]
MSDADPRPDDAALHASVSSALIFARALDGAGGARVVGWEELSDWPSAGGDATLWVHLDRTTPGIDTWLSRRLAVSGTTLEQLISNDTRPRAFREDDALVTILRGINLNPGDEPEDMIAMQIWADASRVVTLRRRRLQTPQDVKDDLDAGRGPHSAGELVAGLIEKLAAKMNNSIVAMNDRIDRLEDMPASADTARMLDEIGDIRRQCLALQRFMSPQHDALQQICGDPPPWLDRDNVRHIRETMERLRRYLDDLNVSKESAIVLQDDLNNRAAAQSNKTMYLLSIVAAIFLPLSFVTGLLGINVGGMPGVESQDAFWITVGALAALMALQIWIFRKIKWL